MPDKHSNKERIKEITAGIEKGIQELFESDRYRKRSGRKDSAGKDLRTAFLKGGVNRLSGK